MCFALSYIWIQRAAANTYILSTVSGLHEIAIVNIRKDTFPRNVIRIETLQYLYSELVFIRPCSTSTSTDVQRDNVDFAIIFRNKTKRIYVCNIWEMRICIRIKVTHCPYTQIKRISISFRIFLISSILKISFYFHLF